MQLRGWLAKAEADLLAGPHPDRARRDAEALLSHVIGKGHAWLLTHFDDDFAGCTAIRYAGLLQRRLTGEPIQYITGECEFYGLPFRVTPNVLIPRPETEHLVERANAILPHFPKPRIADLGTGSGAIAIALAHHWPMAVVTAIDISEDALVIARINAQQTGLEDRIRFVQGDLLTPVASEQFEIIVSNPPYVPATDRDTLSVEVRDFEPALALFAGGDGLDVYRRLIPLIFSALVPGGFIVLEIGYGQSGTVRALLTDAGFADVECTPDLRQIPRVASARRP